PVPMRGRLTDVVQITHDISEFGFALDGPDDFLPGQYALIELEGVNGARPYSMCNLPGTGEWRFHVKHVPGGAATGVLFADLRSGDSVGLDGPYGHAHLREDRPGNLLLVAGGSGLSPMISIVRAAAASPALSDREIHFFYGGRHPRDICTDTMLAQLPGLGRRLTHVVAISEPSPGWSGPVGFIHEVVRERLGERLAEFEIYFAGPPPMAQAMQVMLHEVGVAPDRMHFDEFF
ncbi:MAG: FAD-binding oxidoreductase, partial [Acidimicrobiia bacterium]